MRLAVEKDARRARAMARGTTITKKEPYGRIIRSHTQGLSEHSLHATKGRRSRRVLKAEFTWPYALQV